MRTTRVTTRRIYRALIVLPPTVASIGLLLVLLPLVGPWQPLLLGAWVCGGPLLWWRPAERVAVRALYRMRPSTTAETAVLRPVFSEAAARCELPGRALDWYVRDLQEVNAFSAGRRSVAVTVGLLSAYRRGALTSEQMTAVIAHELGHLAVRSAAPANLAVVWWTLPWRVASHAAAVIGRSMVQRMLFGRAVLVLGPIAAVKAASDLYADKAWSALVLLGLILFMITVHPVLEAAVARTGEYAADRYVDERGMGADLAAVLTRLPEMPGDDRGPLARLLVHHPAAQSRLTRLQRLEDTTPSALVE
jgi:STE24 endopeptidase